MYALSLCEGLIESYSNSIQIPILIYNLLNKLWVAHFGSLSGSKTDVSLKK